jgi:hypothetical protein
MTVIRWAGFILVVASPLLLGCPEEQRRVNITEPVVPPPAPLPQTAVLQITPSIQQTTVWCWAAAAEMVLRHHDLPNLNPVGNFQCGIVAAWFSATVPACLSDCGLCVSPIGPMSNLQQLINGYGVFANAVGVPSRVLTSQLVFRALGPDEAATEIVAGRPFAIGISPGPAFAVPNISEHFAVVIGYDYRNGAGDLIVNDPFPFHLPPFNASQNPYLAAGGSLIQSGQYRINGNTLIAAMDWANTIYLIQ